MNTTLTWIIDEFQLYQREAYEIAERVLIAASERMAVGYRPGGKFELGHGNPDYFFFYYMEKHNWGWPGLYIDQENWDTLIMGK